MPSSALGGAGCAHFRGACGHPARCSTAARRTGLRVAAGDAHPAAASDDALSRLGVDHLRRQRHGL
eukprot:6101421-Prymnesium_polylepis.1